jgi:hypothetical protein
MKKVLVGCLVVAVLGGVVLAVGSYLLYRAASPLIQDARGYLAGMSQLEEVEKGLQHTAPYTPPVSEELTGAQVERFVRVQDHVRMRLGQRITEIEQKYRYLKENQPDAQPGFFELLNSLREMTTVFVEARRYQVEALNKEGFSQQEYAWVRNRMYHAAGMEIGSGVDIEKLREAVRSGAGVDAIRPDRLPLGNVPAKNRELVKPHVERMDDWLPLLFFGL